MYEMIYSRNKSLQEDSRLTYFSFATVMSYAEELYLGIFSVLYTVSAGLTIELARPYEGSLLWPFTYYTYGATAGLLIVIVVSDFIFQQRMVFAPIFLFGSLSLCFHCVYLIVHLVNHGSFELTTRQWLMACEGCFDITIQFYMYYMAPIQIARLHRLTQEITPAGTLISMNMLVGIYVGTTLH